MKRISILFLTLSIMAFLVNYLFAQGIVTKGLKGGLNLTNIISEDVKNTDVRIGFSIGGFLTYYLNDLFALQPEIYFSSKGFKFEKDEISSYQNNRYSNLLKSSVTLNYLEVPLLGVFSINKNIRLVVGPYIDIYLNGIAKSESKLVEEYYDPYGKNWIISNQKRDNDINNIDSDMMNGQGSGFILGTEFMVGSISLGARYSHGLSNLFESNDEMSKHRVIQALLSFEFK